MTLISSGGASLTASGPITADVTNDGTFAFESGHNLATVVSDLATVLTSLASILTHITSLDTKLPPASQTVSGTVTANAGTNLNTSLLALESGGNLAAIETHIASLDSKLPPTSQTVSGTVTANAGTNLNTSLLALESGGNLATLVTNTTGIPTKLATLKATSDLTTSGSAQKTVTTPLSGRQGIYIFNNDGTNNVRWGDSAITTSKGGRIPAGTGLWVAAGPSVDVYVIAEAGSPVVSLTEAA